MTVTIEPALTKTDLRCILQVYRAYTEIMPAPFLPASKWQKRMKALADRGLLQALPGPLPPDDWCRHLFLPTQAGIEAYNAAITEARRKAAAQQ